MRLGNVRWLAGYRHPRHRLLEVTAWLREAFATETPLMTGVESVGDPIMVLPVLFHLLWWQELVTDLSQATPPAVSPRRSWPPPPASTGASRPSTGSGT